MRLMRDKVQRAVKTMKSGNPKPRKYGSEGPKCKICAPEINGKLTRQTILDREHAKEIAEYL